MSMADLWEQSEDLEDIDNDESPINRGIWITKSGAEIAIVDMSHSHLINTINLIKKHERLTRTAEAYIEMMECELINRTKNNEKNNTKNF